MTLPERISIIAAAHSIYVCAERLFSPKCSQLLIPKLLPGNEISLSGTVIFTDQQFNNILERGFGVPKVSSFFFSPYHSFRILFYLWKVGEFYKSKSCKESSDILLRASLEAVCTYMNLDKKAGSIFDSEKTKCFSVGISGFDTKYLIFNQKHSGWTVRMVEESFSTSASLSFNNFETARDASLGRIDTWHALSTGDIQLRGQIPLLDKFGYVARIAQRKVPMPK